MASIWRWAERAKHSPAWQGGTCTTAAECSCVVSLATVLWVTLSDTTGLFTIHERLKGRKIHTPLSGHWPFSLGLIWLALVITVFLLDHRPCHCHCHCLLDLVLDRGPHLPTVCYCRAGADKSKMAKDFGHQSRVSDESRNIHDGFFRRHLDG